jgi:hypothetical protein
MEKITYLTGNFLQLSQFAVKNAFRVLYLAKAVSSYDGKLEKSLVLAGAESLAKSAIVDNESIGSEALLKLLSAGLSEREQASLRFVILKRDYLVSYFYIDNATPLAREEVAVYESKITELNEYCKRATTLNQELSKSADKIYDTF